MPNALIAIVPRNALEAGEAFDVQLGFRRRDNDDASRRVFVHSAWRNGKRG